MYLQTIAPSEDSDQPVRKFRSACAFAEADQSSLGSFWITKDAMFLHVDKEDSN